MNDDAYRDIVVAELLERYSERLRLVVVPSMQNMLCINAPGFSGRRIWPAVVDGTLNVLLTSFEFGWRVLYSADMADPDCFPGLYRAVEEFATSREPVRVQRS